MSPTAHIEVDCARSEGSLPPFSLFFGCDEPNYAYYPHGSGLLETIGTLGGKHKQTFFRTHNLLSTGDGSKGLVGVPGLKWGSTDVYTEDCEGNPMYNFKIVDRILDEYLARGIRPYLQFGFMPYALAEHPEPYFFDFHDTDDPRSIFKGWTHPPKSYAKWEELCYQWTTHNVERYGKEECEKWWFECWNEADGDYWSGTQEDFFRLHDHCVNAVRRALPTARVGGPDLASPVGQGKWLEAFIEHCLYGQNYATGEIGTPLDFISWHAKGWPSYYRSPGERDEHVRMDLSVQLRIVDEAMEVVSRYPRLRNTPIILGEFDPEGCAAALGPGWQYRNSLLYPSYTAVSFIKALELAKRHRVNLHGILTWAFQFEASKINPDRDALFDGLRSLSTQGIDKSVLNIHRMLAMMCSEQQVHAVSDRQFSLETTLSSSVRDTPEIGTFATMDSGGKHLEVLVWHYHDDHVPMRDAKVKLAVANIPESCRRSGRSTMVTHYRVDDTHSNAYSVWTKMGSPAKATIDQETELQKRMGLEMLDTPTEVKVSPDGSLRLEFDLPILGVSLLRFSAR